jgi:hypothetical protein
VRPCSNPSTTEKKNLILGKVNKINMKEIKRILDTILGYHAGNQTHSLMDDRQMLYH